MRDVVMWRKGNGALTVPLKPLGHILGIVGAVLFFLYICGIGIKSVFRYNSFHREHAELQREFLAVSKQNTYYKALLSRRNNPEFWELHAKQRLGYVAPGEQVYKVVQEKE